MSGDIVLGPNQRADIRRKIVLAGDDGCGKTSMLLVYAYNKFPEEYIPSISDYVTNRRCDGKLVHAQFWDTDSRDEHERLRPLSYPGSNAILLIFSVDSPESFENIKKKWWPEVTQFSKGTPLVVVGTKTDLRQDDDTRRKLSAQGQMPITSEQGEEVAREIDARYIECSAKTGSGVQEVFTLAVQESMKMKGKDTKARRNRCVVI